MNTNLFKITYPSGLIEHVRDIAVSAEAMLAKISGQTIDEAKAMGLKIEHMIGMEGDPPPTGVMTAITGAASGVDPNPVGVPVDALVPATPALPTLEQSAAIAAAVLSTAPTVPALPVEMPADTANVAKAAQARFMAMAAAAEQRAQAALKLAEEEAQRIEQSPTFQHALAEVKAEFSADEASLLHLDPTKAPPAV